MRNIFIAGHNGMVGRALARQLKSNSNVNLITANRDELDLCQQSAVADFLCNKKIDEIYLAAAKVGGIHANNTYPAEFIHNNLSITLNIIQSAHLNGVNKLLFLGSSCIYPRNATQPMSETELLTGTLELSNEPYAIAKIAGIKMCESYARQYNRDYRSIMPTNLYGPDDNFHPENSHVIPGLLQRFDKAIQLNSPMLAIWGTGKPMREFLHVDDMAKASIHLMDISRELYENITSPSCAHVNAGTGQDCTIAELTRTIKEVTGYKGELTFDTSKPDGTPRKLLDVSRIQSTGWKHSISLQDGLTHTWNWYQDNKEALRSA